MKNLLLAIALAFLAQIGHTQIQLEHTYPKGTLKRIGLDISGERYAFTTVDGTIGTSISLFEPNHAQTGIKFIAIEPNSSQLLGGIFLSEQIIDNDPETELVFGWGIDGEDVFGTTLMKETGEKDWFPCMHLDLQTGLSPKLICEPRVYGLPGVQIEHVFSDIDCYSDNCDIWRLKFPLDGEQYLVNPGYSPEVHIYDATFNWIRTIVPPKVSNTGVFNFTQQFFNNDPLLEVYGTKTALNPDLNGNGYLFQIAQENGTVLFSEQCTAGLLSVFPNLSSQLLIQKYATPGVLITKVLDAKTFEEVHIFPGRVTRISPDGIKAYYRSAEIVNNTLTMYDGNSFDSMSIHLGAPNPSLSAIQFARNRLAQNGKLELFYNLGDEVKWINEDGVLLHTFDGATSSVIDQQPGMEDKLMVRYADSTQVYRFVTPSTTIFEVPENPTISVSPNPFSRSIEVKFSQSGDYSVLLSDIFGRCILTQTVSNQEKTIFQIPANCHEGLYFLSVSGDGFQNCLKLVKGK